MRVLKSVEWELTILGDMRIIINYFLKNEIGLLNKWNVILKKKDFLNEYKVLKY